MVVGKWLKEMKNDKQYKEGFHLVANTAGKVSNGVYVKDDDSEVIIRFAWGDDLHFRTLGENEKSL